MGTISKKSLVEKYKRLIQKGFDVNSETMKIIRERLKEKTDTQFDDNGNILD